VGGRTAERAGEGGREGGQAEGRAGSHNVGGRGGGPAGGQASERASGTAGRPNRLAGYGRVGRQTLFFGTGTAYIWSGKRAPRDTSERAALPTQ
jgi:hypothetical protein